MHHTTPHSTPPHQICMLNAGRQASLRTDNTLLQGMDAIFAVLKPLSAKVDNLQEEIHAVKELVTQVKFLFFQLTVGNCLFSKRSDKLMRDMRALQQLRWTTASKPHCTDRAALSCGCQGSLVG